MVQKIRTYGFLGSGKLFVSLVYTKLFFPGARLIRLPFDIRNRTFMKIGENLTTGFGCRLEAYPKPDHEGKVLFIGKNVEINDYVHIAAGENITIGNDVLIASKVFISDINHGNYNGKGSDSPIRAPSERSLFTKPVTIEDNVWIGESVCILPGVRIGRGSIVGSLSVVTKDVPPKSIVVGSPAKVIKYYDEEKGEWLKNI